MIESWIALATQGWAAANATNAPLLPTLGAQQMWLHSAWALVLAWGVVVVLRRFFTGLWLPWGLAGIVVVWVYLPGAYSPSYWLGLAFQAPSVTTVGLCGIALVRMTNARPQVFWGISDARGVLAMGILVGWLLLFDTFALLPGVGLYAWGFSPLAPAVLMVAVVLPWVLSGARTVVWLFALAVVTPLMVLHVPSGNAWDAVIDPWLWGTLHVWAWRLTREPASPHGRDRPVWPS